MKKQEDGYVANAAGLAHDQMNLNPYVKANQMGVSGGQWFNKLSDERRQQLAATNAQPALNSKIYGQPQTQADINLRATQMIRSGNAAWAERLTKKEVVKFIETLAVQNQSSDSNSWIQTKLIQELSHGNKNWADRIQKEELVQIAEHLCVQSEMDQNMMGMTDGQMRMGGRMDDTLARDMGSSMHNTPFKSAKGPMGGMRGMMGTQNLRNPQTLQKMNMREDTRALGPKEFQYSYDFDENGALFFLGSGGKRKVWQNPHLLGQVEAFASSIGSGSVEVFVGRNTVNCRTLDEPLSFFGVDLGPDRRLLPTLYTLRNRGETTHVLLSW